MLDQQENKRSMYGAVSAQLKENKTLWEGLPYFVSNVEAFLAIIEAIDEVTLVQTINNTGAAEDKQYRRDELEESAMVVVNILWSYASFIKDKDLRSLLHYTPSSLKTSTGNNLIVDTSVIHSIATDNLTGAAAFGLNEDLLNDLLAKNAAFLEFINAPSNQRSNKKNATDELKRLFGEGDSILKNSIDRDIIIFKKSQRDFYLTYFICRKIINTPKTKLAMRIKIVNAESKKAIPKALVVIKDHSIKRKSSPLGAMHIRHLKEGKHTVTVSMKGYATQAVRATHNAGETSLLTVEMVKVDLGI